METDTAEKQVQVDEMSAAGGSTVKFKTLSLNAAKRSTTAKPDTVMDEAVPVLESATDIDVAFQSLANQRESTSPGAGYSVEDDDIQVVPSPQSSKRLALQKFRLDKPGPVRPKATLMLHTNIVHMLFYGRSRSNETAEILGFIFFAGMVRKIEDAARQDDPYADYLLLELEAEIHQIKQDVDQRQSEYDQKLQMTKNLNIDMASAVSVQPAIAQLDFKSRIGSLAVLALAGFDTVLLKGLTLRHFGLIEKEVMNHHKNQLRTHFNRLFQRPRKFRASGASRNDFAANNARAREAREKFGELPEAVLRGDMKPGY